MFFDIQELALHPVDFKEEIQPGISIWAKRFVSSRL